MIGNVAGLSVQGFPAVDHSVASWGSDVVGRPLAATPVRGERRDAVAFGVGEDAPQAVGVRPDNYREDGPGPGGTRRFHRASTSVGLVCHATVARSASEVTP